MAKLTLYTRNILETGTVTMTGTPDSGYPLSRLYDRSKNFYWKDTVTEAKTLLVDQGASNILDVDFLAIVSHNFDALALSWDYSADNAAWGTICFGVEALSHRSSAIALAVSSKYSMTRV